MFEDNAAEEEDEETVEDNQKPNISQLVIPTNINEIAQKQTKVSSKSKPPVVKTTVKMHKRPRMTQSSLEEELADE